MSRGTRITQTSHARTPKHSDREMGLAAFEAHRAHHPHVLTDEVVEGLKARPDATNYWLGFWIAVGKEDQRRTSGKTQSRREKT